MNRDELLSLFRSVRDGETAPEAALERTRALPFKELGFAKVDLHREVRAGRPEVVFCKGKTPERSARIVAALREAGQNVLATRADEATFEACRAARPEMRYHPESGVATNLDLTDPERGEGLVLVVSAGTADIPVAEEALLTARACGARAESIYDVGVAGLHRLLGCVERLQSARALVVVAGMEGALPSVVGGLVAAPVIATPTSVGYGASFGGLAALLGMLNSCSSNVTVVNIDNGFGAGYVASMIAAPPADRRAT